MFSPRNILCFSLLFLLAGCGEPPGFQTAQYVSASSSYAGPAPVRRSDGPYVLGPGDRVRIKVYSDPDMSGEYGIGSNGTVSVPLVGAIKAVGLTTRQLEQTIAARMKGKVANEPHVSVDIASYAPYYVYGEVKSAGELEYHVGLTVADAVAAAGGLTYRADPHRIYLRRAGATVEQMVALDAPVRIYPGDNLRVAESFF